MDNKKYPYADITEKIIGCAMKVHNKLRNGFQEVIYQRALAIEMRKADLNFQREFEMDIYYDDEVIGKRRVDFFVEDKIMVEIKALSELDNTQPAQTINYLEAFNVEIGLLLNFGAESLQFRRFINNKYRKPIVKI
jgi:GxxExxY protein